MWFVRTCVYPADFEPVELSHSERREPGSKLCALGIDPEAVLPSAAPDSFDKHGRLIPEKCAEDPSRREIEIRAGELLVNLRE